MGIILDRTGFGQRGCHGSIEEILNFTRPSVRKLENKVCQKFEMGVWNTDSIVVCRCILSTDMAKHNDIVKTFRAMIASFDITAKDHKEIVSR